MRTRMYGGVRGRKTKKVGRNSKIFVFLLLDHMFDIVTYSNFKWRLEIKCLLCKR